MQAAKPMARLLISRNVASLSRAYHAEGHGNHRVATLNDLPVPEGDWQEAHSKKQAKYNTVLAGSALIFVGVVGYIRQSGVIDFNFSPPKTYE